MRKLLIFISALVISITLVACEGDGTVITPPSYVGVRVESVDPIQDGDYFTFFRGKSDTVLVEVTLINPDNARIKSVDINGYTYLYTKFKEETTSTVIYFEVNVGTTLGETIYSVDKISYFDGENSIDVNVSQNNEFRVYVYKDEPTVLRENYALQRTSISIDFSITDNDQVVAANTLKALLYAGETLLETKTISSGFTRVEFTDLLANRLYEVKIVATYDLDDNAGLQTNVILYSGTYSTIANGLPSSNLSNIQVTSNRIDFDLNFTDDDEVVVDGGLSVAIFNGDTLVESIDVNGATTGLNFEDLYNDSDYIIRVLADYNLRDGQGIREDNVLAIYEFSTLPRQVPTPLLDNLTILENSIEFDVVIDDPDGIIHEDSIIAKLYIEGEYIDQTQIYNYHADFQVSNLFANKDFTIELVADYNLNDGNGDQENQVIYSETYTTTLNDIPSVRVNSLVVEQGYITVELTVEDPNHTLMGAIEAVLYEEGSIVQTILIDSETTEIVFDYASEAGIPYYIEFFADYNLRDATGAVYNQSLRRVVSFTAEAKAPIAEISNVVTTSEDMSFDIRIVDADGTIVAGQTIVYIYLNDVLYGSQVLTLGDNTVSFDGLLSNNEYTIIVESDFNLDDGSGVLDNQQLLSTAIMTDTKTIPSSESSNIETTDTSLSFDVSIFDTDSVVEDGTIIAILYHEGVEIATQALINGDNYGIEFDTLLSDNNYVIKFFLDYDLNDGEGIITDYQVGETTIRTDAKSAPVIDVIYSETDENTITLDITVDDEYNVINGDVTAILVLNEVPVPGYEVPLTVGTNTDVTFDNIYSNERYYVEVIADYDLNDGSSVFTDELLYSDYFLTDGFLPVTGFIDNVVSTTHSIIFDAYVTDDDTVITGNLQAVLYLDDTPTGDTIPLVVGENLGVTFTGIDSATDYVITIETDYDLNEETGPVLAEVLFTVAQSTLALSPPTITFSSIIPDYDSFSVDVLVNDVDGTVTGNTKAVLYKDDAPTGQEVVLNTGLNHNVSFTGLLSDNQYEVRVFTDYDLNDEAGVQANEYMGNQFVTTLAKSIPLVEVSNEVLTTDSITFDVEVNDTDSVLETGVITVGLYVSGVPVSMQQLETNTVYFDISGFIANFDFEIYIIADYDLDDGSGVVSPGTLDILEYTTVAFDAPTATIDDVTITQTGIIADITVTDDDQTSTNNLEAILYDESDTELGRLSLVSGVNTITFVTVANFQELYHIVVESDYDVRDGLGVTPDSVLAETVFAEYNKLVPESEISNIVVDKTSITVDVMVYDDDVVITGNTYIQLYLDGVYQTQNIVVTGANPGETFTGLLSGVPYEVRVVTDYNNGDGNGIYDGHVMSTETITTTAKDVPTASYVLDTVTDDTILVDVTITDTDSVSSSRSVVLYDANGTEVSRVGVGVGTTNNVPFTGLYSNYTYTIQIEVDYDLNDGVTTYTDEMLYTGNVATDSIGAPSGEIIGTGVTSDTVTVIVDITDDYSAITNNLLAVLYDNGVQVDSEPLVLGSQTVTFTGHDASTEYLVEIVTDYDVNEVSGEVFGEVLDFVYLTTEGLSAPTAVITNTTSTTSTIVVDYNLTDDDSVTTSRYLRIYDGAVQVSEEAITAGSGQTHTFTNLTPNKEYTVTIETTYDISDGNGVQSDVELDSEVVSTSSFITFEYNVEDDIQKRQATMDIVVDNSEGLLTSTVLTATLYQGIATVGTYIVTADTPTTINMINLLSDFEYTLEITASYDVGAGTVTEVVDSVTFITDPLVLPTVDLDPFADWTLSPNVIADVTIGFDADNAVSDTGWIAYLYVDGVLQETVDIDNVYGNPEGTDASTPVTTTITFAYSVNPGEAYTIIISALVDLNDEAGVGAVETALESATGIDAGN